LTLGGLGIANPKSLLDNAPLKRLLADNLHLAGIDEAIACGWLRAFGVTASSYGTGRAITFFQGATEIATGQTSPVSRAAQSDRSWMMFGRPVEQLKRHECATSGIMHRPTV
jgi:hypothetical protein